jgi:hypothetical protein
MPNPALVIITPVYEDREASLQLFRNIRKEFGDSAFIVAVEDGSVRAPLTIDSFIDAGVPGLILKLKRNVGHQRAIAIGIGYVADHLASARAFVVMDSDGEDVPASIRALLSPLAADDVDIAVAERKSRVETLRFRAFYVVYKTIFGLLTGRKIAFGNFMAMKLGALQRLSVMPELWIHIAGCVLASKLRVASRPLDRGQRYAGQSNMNFVGLALHGFRALMVFAEDVLVRVGIACTLVAALSILGGAAAVILKLLGIATPGWFSVAIGILFLVFLQTGTLTLVTLMLTGVVRGGSVVAVDYEDFIDVVLHPPAQPAVID